jgi:hypothetical protein
MKFIKGVVLGALVAMPAAGLAQGSDTNVVWKKSITAGASYKDGNSDKKVFTANIKVDRTTELSEWISSLYSMYGKTDGDQTDGQLRLQSEYRYKFRDSDWYAGVFTEGYHDDVRDISYRAKIGPNIGYYWVNDEKMKFDTSVGINVVSEQNSEKTTQYGEYRLAANYLWDFTENATYYASVEYVMEMDDTEEGNGLFTTGLRSKINNQLSMTIELRDEYDNKPASDDVENNDLTILAGLTYDF